MSAAMVHRGPDDRGEYVDRDRNVALAARRLSIIDIEGGHQPLANEDGTIWAVCNGEIYNYQTLRQHLSRRGHALRTESDTEVLVHLYEEYGVELPHALEGMYSFAIWDAGNEVLMLCRDRFGEKPLFYKEQSGQLVFASELSALLAGLKGRHELSPVAVDEFFTLGYVRGPETIVQGVHQLDPGSSLVWSRRRETEKRRYWDLPSASIPRNQHVQDLVAEARDLLAKSVRSRLHADVPVGVFLSGGIDSSLVAQLAAEQAHGSLQTFTVGYEGSQEDERGHARRVSELLDSHHHELVLTSSEIAAHVPSFLAALDQPLADEAFVPLRALSHFARSTVTVAVGGEGADELFGGYPRYRWLVRSARIPGWVPRKVLSSGLDRLERISQDRRVARLRDVVRPIPTQSRHLRWVTADRLDSRDRVYGPRLNGLPKFELGGSSRTRQSGEGAPESVARDFMFLDTTEWLPDDVLMKADRASMHASLEFRTPYLHRELAEFAASIPASLHISGRGKYLLREVLRGESGPRMENRRKAAFSAPVDRWLRGPLAAALDEHLASSAAYSQGWFNRSGVETLLSEHRSRARDWSRVIWPVFAFGTWLDNQPMLRV